MGDASLIHNPNINLDEIKIVNKISLNWREKIQTQYTQKLLEGTQVKVSPVKSLLKISGQTGQYVEEVVLEIKLPQRPTRSFSALADSQTGRIITTWNLDIVEGRGGNGGGRMRLQATNY
jgi:hypothetical protein